MTLALLIEITEPSQKSLNPMKQSCKKIGDEEGIGKDQCPTDYAFKVDLNFSSLSRFVNSKNFFPITYRSYDNFVGKGQICGITQVFYQSSNRLLTIFKNAKPPRIIRQIINKVEKTNSFTIRLAPPSRLGI